MHMEVLHLDSTPTIPICKSYQKLTRIHLWPAGTVLWWWPCMWGLTMSAYRLKTPLQQIIIQATVYLLACTIRHNAACIWNDICDRNYDRQVERTKTRPIAAAIISVPSALLFLGAHIVAYVAVIYPFCKRFTNWPQAVLGLDSAWGTPIAWMTNDATMDWALMTCICLGITCWIIHLDTIYACQDKKDDARIGIGSCALLFGDYIRPILSIFAASFVVLLTYAGTLNGQGLPYFVLGVGGTSIHLAWQLMSPDLSNADIGALVWAGLLADYARKLV
ncbi:uncharacterized protein B0H18DRAFT_1083561 [Fomitopsis serialis]|uniref:uncharacterized protein n=1 Tax=Fomitopsis serialis TaxID=139415 RepID=UPI00200755CA|nr:uncharacterized protein B0H18DRAFT_1083561 [Neoantrodia serialis]KAH9931273.1 hypothetical protein B0H18DRAFT_1083561 [Neoantrodia serialis]